MKLKNVFFLVLFFPFSLFAKETNCFVGAGLGSSYIAKLNAETVSGSVGVSADLVNVDKKHLGAKMDLQCFFAEEQKGFHIGYGAGLFSFGDISSSLNIFSSVPLTEEEKAQLVDKLWFPSSAAAVFVIPTYSFNDAIHVSAKGGLMLWKTKFDFDNSSYSKTDYSFYYGAELKFVPSKMFALGFAWDAARYRKRISNLTSLNVYYRFNL